MMYAVPLYPCVESGAGRLARTAKPAAISVMQPDACCELPPTVMTTFVKYIERHRALAGLVIRAEKALVRMVVVEIAAKRHDLHVIDPPPAHDDADRVFEVGLVSLDWTNKDCRRASVALSTTDSTVLCER
jgi:hypothetical protein